MSLVAIAAFRFGLSDTRAEAVAKIARERYASEPYLTALDRAAVDYLVDLPDDEVEALNAETEELRTLH